MATRIDLILRQLDHLLDDDASYQALEAIAVHARRDASAQTSVRLELSGDRGSGGQKPGAALVLPPILAGDA
jgi:hypothetical protein